MKKLMIAAAIVCAAAFAQAATISWGLGTIYGAGDNGKGWSSEGLAGSATVQLIVGSTLSNGVIGDTVYNDSTTMTFSDGNAYPDAIENVSMVNDKAYYSQIVITQGDSTLKSGIFALTAAAANDGVAEPNWAIAGEVAGLDDSTMSALAGIDTFHDTYGTFTAAGWQSVPEPTSGLLLLIGVAGLALRRRRA